MGWAKTYSLSLSNLYFIIFSISASIIYALQMANFPLNPLLNNYLNDFLCMPIVLFICQHAVRLFRSDTHFQMPIALILSLCFVYAFYFEYYLPLKYVRYTADYIDVFLYFFGGVCFYLLERFNIRYKKSQRKFDSKDSFQSPSVNPKLTFDALSSSKSESKRITE